MPSFHEVLGRIREHEGELFHTFTGLEFTYRFDETDGFYTSRTKYRTTLRNLEFAYSLVPADEGPSAWRTTVRAYSYLWAVLHDNRSSPSNAPCAKRSSRLLP